MPCIHSLLPNCPHCPKPTKAKNVKSDIYPRLKPVRLENGDGQNLSVCPKCFGTGTFTKAERTAEKEGVPVTETIFCKEADMRRLKKDGWRFERGACSHCKGAGMVRADAEHVW